MGLTAYNSWQDTEENLRHSPQIDHPKATPQKTSLKILIAICDAILLGRSFMMMRAMQRGVRQ